MSIINEALKKTEENLQKNTVKDNFIAPKPASKRLLIYILILLAGLFLGNFIFSLLSHKIQTAQTPKQNVLAATQTAIPSSPVALPAPQPEEKVKEPPQESLFVLNGIFFSDNDGYALINNQIVRENDYVDGAKVSSITANTVKLDNAGQIITLSTHR